MLACPHQLSKCSVQARCATRQIKRTQTLQPPWACCTCVESYCCVSVPQCFIRRTIQCVSFRMEFSRCAVQKAPACPFCSCSCLMHAVDTHLGQPCKAPLTGAQICFLFLMIWGVTGALVWEAILRILNPEPVNGKREYGHA
eukprot:scaffold70012_cov25-Tisochrysis_lutea.AAC.1